MHAAAAQPAPQHRRTASPAPTDPRAEVTLAVVTRDRAALLKRHVLSSMRAAANAGLPVLLVDQSRGDETRAVIRAEPGITYLTSGPGLSVGRNVALRHAHTPLIAFTDDDVEPDEGWLDLVSAAFAEEPRAGAVCGRGRTSSGAALPAAAHGVYRWPADPFSLGNGFCMALRMEAMAEIGDFDEDLGAGGRFGAGEDTDVLHRLLRAGWSVVCRNDITVTHHDWRTKRQELALHYRYGIGMGAQTAKHRRAGDREAVRIGLRRVRMQLSRIGRSLAQRRPRTALIEAVYLPGAAYGFIRRTRGRQ